MQIITQQQERVSHKPITLTFRKLGINLVNSIFLGCLNKHQHSSKLENGRCMPGCLTVQSAIRVSTKKTLCTLVKKVRKLHVTPHACKGNAPVNMKEKYVYVQAMKRGYRRVYVCVIINEISSRRAWSAHFLVLN